MDGFVENSMQARLPSIRELDLSCSFRSPEKHGHESFDAPRAATLSGRDYSPGSSASDYPPRKCYQRHTVASTRSSDGTRSRAPITVTPPSSPVCAMVHQGDISSNDDAVVAEGRRQRRECKERRRRRDQRSLTVRMEQSVPPWVFGRLRTRHSGSKVNGGGRATNAVISGACIWLRVQERAIQEDAPSWEHGKGRWVELVDEEAAALEGWSAEGDKDKARSKVPMQDVQ